MIDRFSHWPEAIPLNDITASSCGQALVSNWIARFSIPLDISSDRGPQFASHLWTAISRLLGTNLHHTTAYHPQSNGLVERFHRHLKSALRARLSGPSWIQELPWVLLGIRTAPKEDLGCSSAEMVYGAPLTVPGDFLPSQGKYTATDLHLRQLRDQVRSFVPVPTSQHGAVSTSVPANLQQAKFVFICRDAHCTPLQRPYEGPIKVIQPCPKTFQVDIGGETKTISVDRLKPAHTEPGYSTQVTELRCYGRPHQPPQPLSTIPTPNTHNTLQQRCMRSGQQVKLPQRSSWFWGGVV